MENRACHTGGGEQQKRTNSAMPKAQKQTHYKTGLVRLNVAEEPPIQPEASRNVCQNDCFFLAAFASLMTLGRGVLRQQRIHSTDHRFRRDLAHRETGTNRRKLGHRRARFSV